METTRGGAGADAGSAGPHVGFELEALNCKSINNLFGVSTLCNHASSSLSIWYSSSAIPPQAPHLSYF